MNKIIGSSTIAKDISDQKLFEAEILKARPVKYFRRIGRQH